ncbi:hypothetical protein C7444_11579 [Sphaerotilus hippei]|uniref:TM2 domain-containing protein n=1 Tax=Sphaerotilus hippei TaxID=744406 RepID=A0A318GY04_9BURK|nr:TM2 domain-containing protein [Sphaerotilus hippei]PXW94184.1 hypothetical protein C7444_11579 [Sphaerotilus hippei]
MKGVKSRTLATWLAVLAGTLGAHRFYLHGWRDPWGWMFPLPTLLGLWGYGRAIHLGQDDRLSWFLLPIGGLAIAAAMLSALVIGLTPQERWDTRINGDRPSPPGSGLTVLALVVALLIGTTALLSSITYGLQRYFESTVAQIRQP